MKAKRLLTGLVRTRAEAEAFVIRALRAGCGCEDISVVLRADPRRARQQDDVEPVSDGHGALAALMAGMKAVVRRGMKLVPAGPIAAALMSTSGVSHAFVDAGIPEHRARVYEAGLREGWTLVGVSARSEADVAMFEQIFQAFGAAQVCDPDEVERPSALYG